MMPMAVIHSKKQKAARKALPTLTNPLQRSVTP